MNTRLSNPLLIGVAALLMLAGAAGVSRADPPAGTAATPPSVPTPPALSKETREKMATLHEEMAACLRSDKPLGACRNEMVKRCQDLMGGKGCPMMGGPLHGMRGMHEQMMGAPDSSKDPGK
jgi:hypothetical protein